MSGPKQSLKLTINLDAALAGFQISLQHQIDFLTIADAGAKSLSQPDYDRREFFTLFTAPNHRHPLDAAREEFRSWCLMNSLKGAVDHLGVFLEESRTMLALAKLGPRFSGADLTRINVDERATFHSLGLPDKIDRLKGDFGVSSKLEPHIRTLNKLRNCLVHRLGIVGPKDASSESCLRVQWRGMDMFAKGTKTGNEIAIQSTVVVIPEESLLQLRVSDRERRFKIGETVRLAAMEHHQLMFTFSFFALEIAQQVKRQAIADTKTVPPN